MAEDLHSFFIIDPMFQILRSVAYLLSGKPLVLQGLWERVGDDFAGCLILVEEVSDELTGRVTYAPALMRQYGWQVGDLKWKSIRSGRIPAFRIQELFKELDSTTSLVRKSSYQPAQIYFVHEDEFVVTNSAWAGRNTRWQRAEHQNIDQTSAANG